MGMVADGSRGGPVSDPNIVPLIDVLLVLIIIFMVITPTVPTGLPALVPQPASAQSRPEPPDPRTIVVQVMQDGKLMINQEQTDWDSLGTRLFDIFKQRAEKLAFVEGADDVPNVNIVSLEVSLEDDDGAVGDGPVDEIIDQEIQPHSARRTQPTRP